LSKLKSKKL